MRKLLNVLVFISLFVFMHSCINNNKVDENNYIELNNYALKLHFSLNKDSMNKALSIYNKILAQNPHFYVTYLNKASLLEEMGDLNKAIMTLKDANALFKDSVELKLKLAIYLDISGDSLSSRRILCDLNNVYKQIFCKDCHRIKNYTLINGYLVNLLLLRRYKQADMLISKYFNKESNEYSQIIIYRNMTKNELIEVLK